jgi:hypothetical protein
MMASAELQGPVWLFVVGGQDYVFRVIRKRLRELGVNVAGHAPPHWKPPFVVPKYTTQILVVEDDCPSTLRVHAHRLSKELRVPIFEAPARNRWSEAEELLKKHGLIESAAPALAAAPPALAPPELEAREAPPPEQAGVPTEAPVALPAPTAEAPPPVASVTIGEALLLKEQRRQEGDRVKPNLTSPKALALRILKESKGLAGDRPIAEAVNKELSTEVTAYQVGQWRTEAKISKANRGAQPSQVVELLARYGVRRESTAERSRRMVAAKREKKFPGPVARKEKKLPSPRKTQPKPERPQAAAPPPPPVDGEFVAAVRAALAALSEKVIVPYNVSSLSLSFQDGKWEAPEVERTQLVRFRGPVELEL